MQSRSPGTVIARLAAFAFPLALHPIIKSASIAALLQDLLHMNRRGTLLGFWVFLSPWFGFLYRSMWEKTSTH